jgi:hypothetical protein
MNPGGGRVDRDHVQRHGADTGRGDTRSAGDLHAQHDTVATDALLDDGHRTLALSAPGVDEAHWRQHDKPRRSGASGRANGSAPGGGVAAGCAAVVVGVGTVVVGGAVVVDVVVGVLVVVVVVVAGVVVGGGSTANVATTDRAASIVTVHDVVAPEHAPDQPPNVEPDAAEAVSVTLVP